MITHMRRVSIHQSTIANTQVIAAADAAAAARDRQQRTRAALQGYLGLLGGTPPYP